MLIHYPLVAQLKTMLGYRKFRKGTKSEVNEQLRIEKSENPMRIVYSFGISHEHPDTFILTYIRSSNPHHEYVGLYPKGFKFRKKMFEDIDRLVAYFQRHIDDPHDSAPSIRSVAAMVPMRSPATGAFGGWGASNSNEGGWRGHSDRERTSTPGSRTGRDDYRNGGSQDGHPSELPRPYGGWGQGRGRGSYHSGRGNDTGNEKQDSDYGGKKWGSKDDEDGWGSFPGGKVRNTPGREAFPGGWGDGGNGVSGDGDSGWGSGSNSGGWGLRNSGASGSGYTGTDAGDTGWGGTKRSSGQSQAGGGWSGSGGGW